MADGTIDALEEFPKKHKMPPNLIVAERERRKESRRELLNKPEKKQRVELSKKNKK